MGSIMELDDVIYISAVSGVSIISSMVGLNVVESWWLCGGRSNFSII